MEQEFDEYDEDNQDHFETIDSQYTVQNQDSTQQQVTTTSGSKRGRTSDVWRHYTFFDKMVGLAPIKYARCNICGNEYKTPSKYADDYEDSPSNRLSMEIDSYLCTPRQPTYEGQNYDVLKYWESKISVYPILAVMVKDVLAIPITSVAYESSFSMGGRILNKYRPGLCFCLRMLRLVTTQNWLSGYDCDIEEDILEIGKEVIDESFASN
ncbi:uncharacterized protein LOC110713034 [Chenopodium quinoa]|uniref:uncharacterized protein LOC110713034 n=1 Tax=Chenopodium quinoa TaxID=63459 RepID=UPI000B778185|nr:uncharacterized protein LOC110713034 [Chenopodium quinoa]XP_021747195.1 uncharacterized protein LOC110713034 [Chenopodium quinoa]